MHNSSIDELYNLCDRITIPFHLIRQKQKTRNGKYYDRLKRRNYQQSTVLYIPMLVMMR